MELNQFIEVPKEFTSINEAVESVEDVANKIKTTSSRLRNPAEGIRKEIEKVLKEIEKVLDTFINRITHLIKTSKEFLSELIEQTIEGLSNLLNEVDNIVDKILENFNPDAIREKLINPFFDRINTLQKDLFKDLDNLLKKIDTVITGTIEDVVNDIKKFSDPTIFFNPFDPCRREHDIPAWRIGTSLTDIDYYNLVTCHLLKRLDEKDTLDNVTDVYNMLQQVAWKMTCVLRGAPQARQKIFQDWIKYGQLIELWSNFPMTITPLEAAEEAIKKLETARIEFTEKAQKIDNLIISDSINKWYWNTGHELNVGTGDRYDTIYVEFPRGAFKTPPKVQVSINMLDADTQGNVRIRVFPQNITVKGFDIKVRTWSSSKISGIGVTWLAHKI